MHKYSAPQSVKDRVLRRQGKLVSHDTIEAGRVNATAVSSIAAGADSARTVAWKATMSWLVKALIEAPMRSAVSLTSR